MSSPRLRASVVAYLNSVPLFWGLQHGPHSGLIDLDFMLPSKCADALRSGEVQAAIIPSIEYQRIENLKIVPGLCVSSAGPVRSVLLISKVPAARIRALALDTSSRTSVCLVQILLQRRYSVRAELKLMAPNLAEMLRECDAALIIGDPALASDFPGLHVYDLADEWRGLTGLPFVFAFWVVRDGADSGLVTPLQQATAYSLAHLDEIAQEETRRTRLPIPLILSYLSDNIDFCLSEKSLEGLRTFYRFAHELGLIPAVKPLQFLA